MALFKKAQKKETVTKKEASTSVVVPSASLHDYRASRVLKAPRITEKATDTADKNIFVFNVDVSSTKQMIAQAVKEVYKVTPQKIRVVTIPRKGVFVKGVKGSSSIGKKAYVYLKKGDTIEIV